MGTLLNALSNCTFDLQNKRDTSGDFAKKLLDYRNTVVNQYVKTGANLNSAIAEIAKKDNLNDDQIHRILAEVNNQVYLILYDRKRNQNDRDVEFEIASLDKIKEILGRKQEKEKVAFYNSLNSAEFEKVASCMNEEKTAGIQNGILEYTYGDISEEGKSKRDERALVKLASMKSENQKDLLKAKCKVNDGFNKLANVAIELKKKFIDVDSIFSKIAKDTELTPKIISTLDEAIDVAINEKVANHKLHDGFTCKINLSLEKTANERFTLGRYSFIKDADIKLEPMIVDGNLIKGYDSLLKIASELKNDIDNLNLVNSKNILMMQKLAKYDLSELDKDYINRLKEEKILKSKEIDLGL